LEGHLERTINRFVKVLLNTLDKTDETPLTLRQLAYVRCHYTEKADVDLMVRDAQMDSIF
ncbi:hypothetical protein HK102_002498, partial [Quaeritorhiza haematococci]